MKKRKTVIWVIAVVIVITFTIAALIDNFRKVDFEDETMAEMIAKTVGVESADKLRVEDLEKITILNIGYTGYYDTLADIEKCPNLKRLFNWLSGICASILSFYGKKNARTREQRASETNRKGIRRYFRKML